MFGGERWRECAVLLGAAAVFLGVCNHRLDLADEGQLIYFAWRTAEGAVPYRDFLHVYGPSFFFFHAALLRVFGAELYVIRIALAILKSLLALLVYRSARRLAAPAWALLAVTLFVALWITPTWILNTPYANHYALALNLAGLLVISRPQGPGIGESLLAGLCFGLASTFKLPSGVFAFTAVVLYLIGSAAPRALSAATAGRLLAARLLALLAAAGLGLVYLLWGRNTVWNMLVLLGPLLATSAVLAWWELRSAPLAAGAVRRLDARASAWRTLVACALGMSLPPAAYVLYFACHDSLGHLGFNLVTGLPRIIDCFVAMPLPDGRTLALLAATAAWLVAAGCACTATARGSTLRGGAWIALGIVAAGMILYWGPRPDPPWPEGRMSTWYQDGMRLLFLIVPLLVWLGLAVSAAGDSPPRALPLYAAHGATSLLSLYPIAGFWHLVMMLPAFLPLLAHGLECLGRRVAPDGAARRLAGAAIAVPVLFIAGPFLHARVTEPPHKPAFAGGVEGASGIVTTRPLASEEILIAYLRERFPSAQRMFAMGNNLMLYFLADRTSVFEREEFFFVHHAFGMIPSWTAAEVVAQDALIERLDRERPLIVDTAEGAAKFRATFPTLARHVDAHYQVERSIAPYRVLTWRGTSGIGAKANFTPYHAVPRLHAQAAAMSIRPARDQSPRRRSSAAAS